MTNIEKMTTEEVRDQFIKAEVVDNKLVISIGVDLLAHAVQWSDYGWDTDLEIKDNLGFARDVAKELEKELGEDGTTLVHKMLDKAAESAVEWGSEHIEYGD